MKNKSRKHWLVLAVLCGLAGGSIGICSNTVGVFYTPVSEDLGILRGTFALHSTLSVFATGVTALVMPGIMERFSYKKTLLTGVLLAGLSTIAMAFSRSVLLFYILGILRGIGAGVFASVPITMVINHWFEKRHGMATSIVFSFSGAAGAVCTPLLTACIEGCGWEAGYLLQGAMIIALALPAMVYPYTLKPESMNLLPYGCEECRKAAAVTGGRSFGTSRCLTAAFLCFCIFSFLHVTISGIAQHMTGFAQSLGYQAGVGAAMMSLAMVGNIVSKLLIGMLSDAWNPLKACLVMIAVNMMSLFIILLGGVYGKTAWLLTGAFIYGTVYSVGAVGIPLLTRYFFGAENYAYAFSRIGFITNIGQSSALALIGYIYDFTGSYHYALTGAVGIHVVDLILLSVVSASVHGRAKRNRPVQNIKEHMA